MFWVVITSCSRVEENIQILDDLADFSVMPGTYNSCLLPKQMIDLTWVFLNFNIPLYTSKAACGPYIQYSTANLETGPTTRKSPLPFCEVVQNLQNPHVFNLNAMQENQTQIYRQPKC